MYLKRGNRFQDLELTTHLRSSGKMQEALLYTQGSMIIQEIKIQDLVTIALQKTSPDRDLLAIKLTPLQNDLQQYRRKEVYFLDQVHMSLRQLFENKVMLISPLDLSIVVEMITEYQGQVVITQISQSYKKDRRLLLLQEWIDYHLLFPRSREICLGQVCMIREIIGI